MHWNNEPLNTIRLVRKGIYEPYSSPVAKEFPAWTRPGDGTYQAFAARARVLIVNANLVPCRRSMAEIDPRPRRSREWKGKVAMAKPMFGTTATQAACLFEVLGTDAG